MRKICAIVLLISISLCACRWTAWDTKIETAVATTLSPSIAESTVFWGKVPLTEKEVEWFNTEFFTSRAREDGTASFNIRNKFLLPVYDSPEKIDLWELFYDGVSPDVHATQAEIDAFDAATGRYFEMDNVKIPRMNMEQIYLEHTGITLDQSERVGVEKMTYLEQYDAYYLEHSDSGYMLYEVLDGYRTEEGLVILHYKEVHETPTRFGQVTLKPNGNSYWFVSNQLLQTK